MKARGRVLVVTDDPELLSSMTTAFEQMNFEVRCALDDAEAAERLLDRPVRLVCIDLNLPRDSGFDVCELVRGDRSLDDVQILVMSDRGTPEEMADAEEAGANAFVRKPFGVPLLRRYVTAMLERRSPSRGTVRELKPSTFPPPSSQRT